jgi:hypothetical protein
VNATVQMHLGVTDFSEPFVQFKAGEMYNPRFTILVYHYLLGQFRIQITDTELQDETAPEGHGSIVQEMCTYRTRKLAEVITLLRYSPDPLQLARTWAKPFNCDFHGGRIKLDNQPSDRPGVCQVCGCTDNDCRLCIERTGHPCSWVNDEHTLCSACAARLVTIGITERAVGWSKNVARQPLTHKTTV